MLEFLRLNLRAFVSEEEGVSSLEYAILAVVIIGIIVAVLGGDNGSITKLFGNMSKTLSKAASVSTGSGTN